MYRNQWDASPVGTAKSGFGTGRRRHDFFENKIIYFKNNYLFFRVSSVMHVDSRPRPPSRPGGARFFAHFLKAFFGPEKPVPSDDFAVTWSFEVISEACFF